MHCTLEQRIIIIISILFLVFQWTTTNFPAANMHHLAYRHCEENYCSISSTAANQLHWKMRLTIVILSSRLRFSTAIRPNDFSLYNTVLDLSNPSNNIVLFTDLSSQLPDQFSLIPICPGRRERDLHISSTFLCSPLRLSTRRTRSLLL